MSISGTLLIYNSISLFVSAESPLQRYNLWTLASNGRLHQEAGSRNERAWYGKSLWLYWGEVLWWERGKCFPWLTSLIRLKETPSRKLVQTLNENEPFPNLPKKDILLMSLNILVPNSFRVSVSLQARDSPKKTYIYQEFFLKFKLERRK